MHLLITAGPTREPIDAVRFISNRSSGKLGLALAAAATEAGHTVTLLLGPVAQAVSEHADLTVHRFESTADLEALLDTHFPACDVLVMAAAVCDYRPKGVHPGKLPREGEGPPSLQLQPTPDLVKRAASMKRPGQRVIAFALEQPEHLERRAMEKLERKGVDAIVANPLATMDGDTITPRWITSSPANASPFANIPANHEELCPGPMSKARFAIWLLNHLRAWQTQG